MFPIHKIIRSKSCSVPRGTSIGPQSFREPVSLTFMVLLNCFSWDSFQHPTSDFQLAISLSMIKSQHLKLNLKLFSDILDKFKSKLGSLINGNFLSNSILDKSFIVQKLAISSSVAFGRTFASNHLAT